MCGRSTGTDRGRTLGGRHDPKGGQTAAQVRIWRKTNKTVLFVTPNIQEAVFLSDRICVLSPHPGRLSAIVDVDLPRPRTVEMKETEHFNELVKIVKNSFEGGSFS